MSNTPTNKNPVFIKNAILSFPNLVTPQNVAREGQPPRIKFGCSLLLPKNDPQIENVIKPAFREVFPNVDTQAHLLKGMCLVDGNTKGKMDAQNNFIVYDGYQDHWAIVLSSNSDKPPKLVDGQLNPITDPIHNSPFYGGCVVDASMTFWFQNNEHGVRINGNLLAVKFVRDGEAFGSSVSLEEATSGFEQNADGSTGRDLSGAMSPTTAPNAFADGSGSVATGALPTDAPAPVGNPAVAPNVTPQNPTPSPVAGDNGFATPVAGQPIGQPAGQPIGTPAGQPPANGEAPF